MRDFLRKVALAILMPIRRVILGPTNSMIVQQRAGDLHLLMDRTEAYARISTESLTLIGEELRQLRGELEALERREFSEGRLRQLTRCELEDLSIGVAHFLNQAEGATGFAAKANLWFNPPTIVQYNEGEVELVEVNERIVELPFAFRALAGLAEGARILDVGSSESTVPLSLASLGYRVTAIDFRPIPFSHPNLDVVTERFEEWEAEPRTFDAITCISTIEHFGIGAYGEAREEAGADRAAIARMRDLLAEEGRLVLTVPFGDGEVNSLQRIYDEEGLGRLLEGWQVEDRLIADRRDPLTWIPRGEEGPVADHHSVVMLVARPKS